MNNTFLSKYQRTLSNLLYENKSLLIAEVENLENPQSLRNWSWISSHDYFDGLLTISLYKTFCRGPMVKSTPNWDDRNSTVHENLWQVKFVTWLRQFPVFFILRWWWNQNLYKRDFAHPNLNRPTGPKVHVISHTKALICSLLCDTFPRNPLLSANHIILFLNYVIFPNKRFIMSKLSISLV